MNQQYGNVGNLGDILKHAALVHLARCLRESVPEGRVRYVDTHAFLLRAPCRDPELWRSEVDTERQRFPAFEDYVALEEGYIRGGSYACSARLVLDVLGAGMVDLVLAEADVKTQSLLQEQLQEACVGPENLLGNAIELGTLRRSRPREPVLALVDPFVLSPELWRDLEPGLSRLFTPETFGLLEVFTYDAKRTRVQWFDAPGSLAGPVAKIDRGPYHLAVYATGSMADAAKRKCEALGWS